jgi:serine/threonine-protein kinase RsbW
VAPDGDLSVPEHACVTFPSAGSRVRVTSGGGGFEAGAVVLDERFEASTLHLLREQVAACMSVVGLPDDRGEDVILAVHELAANAVRHGGGAGRLLMLAADSTLQCQVSDAGPGGGPWPVRQGHGLWLVRAVTDELAASYGPHGSQVTITFRWQGSGHLGAQAT